MHYKYHLNKSESDFELITATLVARFYHLNGDKIKADLFDTFYLHLKNMIMRF